MANEPDIEIQDALSAAERLFTSKAEEQWFSSTNCNRFELRPIDEGRWVLTLGSIGAVKLDNFPTKVIANPVFTARLSNESLEDLYDILYLVLIAPRLELEERAQSIEKHE